MRKSHDGLVGLAKDFGADFKRMREGEAYLFINARKDRLKCLSWNGVLSYVNFVGQKRPLDLDALDEIPRAFTPDGHLDYSKALKRTLALKLSKTRHFSTTERI